MKYVWISVFVLTMGLVGFVWWKYFYVFGEGVKAGDLNYAVYKGNFFKTYEGKIIQQGFGGNSKRGNTFTSYEFEFSIENEKIFKKLEQNGGKYFELRYKEYHGALPWRGNTNYVVDSIINMR
ncbi:MAG: hypothetical protein FDW93_03060 [Bergeyella sp.]|nr:hypothetical protein [Bergeyella sp.]